MIATPDLIALALRWEWLDLALTRLVESFYARIRLDLCAVACGRCGFCFCCTSWGHSCVLNSYPSYRFQLITLCCCLYHSALESPQVRRLYLHSLTLIRFTIHSGPLLSVRSLCNFATQFYTMFHCYLRWVGGIVSQAGPCGNPHQQS